MSPHSVTMCFRSVAVHLVPRVLCLSGYKGIRFGVPLNDLCKDGGFPEALEDLCLHVHKESSLQDIFEKPVFPEEITKLKEKLVKRVNLTKFSVQAITSVLKEFLMELPGGVFSQSTEEELLKIYSLKGQKEKINWSKKVLLSLPPASLHLIKLLFSIFQSMVTSSPRKIDTFTQIALHFIPCLFHSTSAFPDNILPAASVIAAFIENFHQIFDQNMTDLPLVADNQDAAGMSCSASLESLTFPDTCYDSNNLNDLSKLLYEDHEVVEKLRPNTGFYTITYNLEN